MKRFSRRLGGVSMLVLAAGVCVPVIPAAPALARQMVFAGPGGGPMGRAQEPPVSSGELNRYADLLNLTDAQREAARSLLEGMQAEFQTAAEKMREEMQALRDEAQEDGDFTAFREKMPEIMSRMSDSRTRLEKGFFDDLKSTLTDDQTAKWPALERMRRRDQGLPRGRLAGESMDLARIVSDLKLPADAKQSVAPLLEQYESDLDRELIERNKASEKFPIFGPGGPAGAERRIRADDEEFRRTMQEIREASKRIRDVNQRYARQILGALPPEFASSFENRVKRESFPQVFKESYAQRALRAAGEFRDLTPEQKKTLADLAEQHEREAQAINARWSAAILESEANDTSAMLSLPGGAVIAMRDGEQAEGRKDPVAEQREARKKLDDRTVESLKSALNEDQKSRLPEKRKGRDGGDQMSDAGAEGGAVFVQAIATDDGHGRQTMVHAVSVDAGDHPPADGGASGDVVIVNTGGAAPSQAPPADGKPVEETKKP